MFFMNGALADFIKLEAVQVIKAGGKKLICSLINVVETAVVLA
jgi:hypothetical protein